jgi:formylglycine-generating enzyme required for sulfatase activity
VVVIVISAASLAGAQETAAEKYKDAFGTEDKSVRRSPNTLDDLQFSIKLLKAARSSANTGGYRVVLYEKVYEFAARRSSGYKQAIEALNYLSRALPDRRGEWLDKKLKAMSKRYINSYGPGRKEIAKPYLDTMLAVADSKLKDGKTSEAQGLYRRAYSVALQIKSPLRAEIRDKAAKLAAGNALHRRGEQFKRALAAKPSLRNRENLIYYYLLDMDSPKDAVGLITEKVNQSLRRFVPLAASPQAQLEAAACLDLAKWYESLAKRPISPKGRLNVYRRAREYYGKYLLSGDKTNSKELLAKIAVARLDKAIDRMDPSRLTIDCGGGVTMRLIRLKTGKFLMGSPAGEARRGSDEGPQTSVEISKAFYIGVTEVTRQQYTAVVGADLGGVKGATLPVANVSSADVLAFCKKLSTAASREVRLPTEAEWEYACRAGSTTAFCCGNDSSGLGAYAWTSANSAVDKKLQPRAVGGKKPNAWGLFDMHGNVREFALTPYRSSSYAGADSIAPQDPAKCRSTLQRRGGSAGRDTSFCRSANRYYGSSAGDALSGFRVVIEVKSAGSLR